MIIVFRPEAQNHNRILFSILQKKAFRPVFDLPLVAALEQTTRLLQSGQESMSNAEYGDVRGAKGDTAECL